MDDTLGEFLKTYSFDGVIRYGKETRERFHMLRMNARDGARELPLESEQKAKYYCLCGDKLVYVHSDGVAIVALCIPTSSRVNQTVTTGGLLRHDIVAVYECHDSLYVGHHGIMAA